MEPFSTKRSEIEHPMPDFNAPPFILVIGYGNVLRGDDAAGPKVADAVESLALPGVFVLTAHQLLPELAETLASCRMAIFVDARHESEDAETRVIEVTPAVASQTIGHISNPFHLLALTEAAFGQAPPAWLVSVPGLCFEVGDTMSECATRGVRQATECVVELVRASGIEHAHA
jgi:hydrogenase maturation protease